MLSSVCFVWNISLSAGLIFIKKKYFQYNPAESFFLILQGGRSIKKKPYLLLQYINIVQMHWS